VRATPCAGHLSVGGLIKHVAKCERGWIDTILQRDRGLSMEAAQAEYASDFELVPDETIGDVLALYDDVAAATERVIASVADLGQLVPVPPAPWYPADLTAWSVRWVLLHLIEETARHAGHADIVREAVDGATAFPLMASAEAARDAVDAAVAGRGDGVSGRSHRA
jgi:uncharacterized damage-inducible protein DinB